MAPTIERREPTENPQMVPQPVEGHPGMVQVDATWGTIQPMEVADGVRTIGEIDVMNHLEQGLPIVDGRASSFFQAATIPHARNIPHTEIATRLDELDDERPTVFFCNGPQCGQSPHAIRALLDAGYPADRILYFRGGMHDWMTLGLPVVAGGG